VSIVVPFRVFGVGCSAPLVAARRRPLLEFAARSEFSARRSIALMGYAFPFCRWPLPRLYGLPSSGSTDRRSRQSVSSSLRVSRSSRVSSVNPSRPAATVRLLSWALVPFSTCRHRRSTVCEFAALTGFRLQGLATLLTVCSLRSLVDPVSDRQRTWDSPFGVFLPSVRSGVPAHSVPPAVSSAVGPGPAAKSARQTAAPGLFPAEVPFSDRGFSAFAWGDSPGFCPFQGFASRALPGFRPISSHALVSAASEVTQPSGAPESRSARGLSIRCLSVGRRREARNGSDGDADRQPS
jgi:hypothetical protein